MAPKIVDRNKKRLEIIEATFIYLLENGLFDFPLKSLLDYLNMSKGNFYHYFKSKDELIHSLMDELTLNYIKTCELKLDKAKSIQEKFEILFEIYLDDSKVSKSFLKLYNEFLLIYSNSNNEKIKELNNKYLEYLNKTIKNIVEDEIKKGTLKKESLFLINSISATIDGMLLYSFILNDFDLKKEIKNYIEKIILIMKKD